MSYTKKNENIFKGLSEHFKNGQKKITSFEVISKFIYFAHSPNEQF